MINPFYVTVQNDQQRSPSPAGSNEKRTTYKVIVSATDRLLGARSTSSRTEERERGTAESEETGDVRKGDPEQSAEVVERGGGRLWVRPRLAQRARA